MKSKKDIANHYISMAAARIGRTQSKLKRSWERIQFDRSIHGFTIKNHDKIVTDAELALN